MDWGCVEQKARGIASAARDFPRHKDSQDATGLNSGCRCWRHYQESHEDWASKIQGDATVKAKGEPSIDSSGIQAKAKGKDSILRVSTP